MPEIADPDEFLSALPEALAAALAESCSIHQSRWRRGPVTDVDEHAGNAIACERICEQLSFGKFGGEFVELVLGDIRIVRETCREALIEFGRVAEGSAIIFIPMAITGSARFSDSLLGMGGLSVAGAGDEYTLRTPRRAEIVRIVLSAKLSAALLLAAGQGDTGPRVLNCASGLAQLRLQLRSLFAAFANETESGDPAQGRAGLCIRLLGALCLALRSAQDSPPRSSYPSRKRVVERARAHVLERSWETITVADLCSQVGVSRRTLQTCFREVLDTNPLNYLRAIRLDRVRRELRQAASGPLQVQDVAMRWGFWHQSHFANVYRATFGELPSETLRRSA